MSEWMISSSVLIVSVIVMRYFFRDRLSMRVRYALWLLVAVRLLVPLSIAESGFSVLNFLTVQKDGEGQGERKEETAPGAAFVLPAVRLDGQSLESLWDAQPASTANGLTGGENAAYQQSAGSEGEQKPAGRDGREFREEARPGSDTGKNVKGQKETGFRERIQSSGEPERKPERKGEPASSQDAGPDSGTEPASPAEGTGTGLSFGMLSSSSADDGQCTGLPESLAEEGVETASAWRKALAGASALFYVWLAGVAMFSCVLIGMNRQYRKRIYRSRQRVHTDTDSRLPIYVSPMVEAPCMFGLFHPAVYLNPRIAKEGQSLRYILAHENTHYKHGDNLWVLVRAVCVCLHWFNPLVWLAACLSRQDGELACDERALEILGEEERIRYGRTLLDFSEQGGVLSGSLKLSTAMSGGKKQLKERLLMIVGRPRRRAGAMAAVMILTVLCSLMTFTGRVSGQEADGSGATAVISGSGNSPDAPVGTTENGTADPTDRSGESGTESTSIVPIDLGDGKDYALKIGGETALGSGEYRIDWIALNRIHDRTEETLQTIRPEDVRVLYTRSQEDIRNGDGKMWSYSTQEEPLFAKPLRTEENLPAGEVGRFQADGNGQMLSDVAGGAVFAADLNFDGYQDFFLQGGMGDVNIPYYCYLWDPEQGKFVPGYRIPNLRVNEQDQLIESSTDDGDGRRSTKYYRFDQSGILHMVRYVEENQAPDAVFPTLDLTYCETSYGLPAVDEWDYGTEYGGALTERFVYWAREALTELYEWSGTKLDTTCFTVTEFGDFIFGNTPEDIMASRSFYSRAYGARAGFYECIEQMDLVTERVVWYSPVTQWNVPEGIGGMSDFQLVEWYFGRSALAEGETIRNVSRDGEEYIVETEAGQYYSIFLDSATREAELIIGPYDSYPNH